MTVCLVKFDVSSLVVRNRDLAWCATHVVHTDSQRGSENLVSCNSFQPLKISRYGALHRDVLLSVFKRAGNVEMDNKSNDHNSKTNVS
jgi:hypothetical protein